MTDSRYTLIIPTYNRPESLQRLLEYLESEQAKFQISVLDSSRPQEREANRSIVKTSNLLCKHLEFDETIHPFDKFREGIAEVKTPLCGLCADDDILILKGLNASIDFLEQNPDYSVAHGYYFQFSLTPGELQITNYTYYTPGYETDQPLERLHALMRHYQALTYGTYRQEALLKVFDKVKPVKSILGRELLSSALAAVYGRVARLPVIFHGRNLGPSSSYECWHPLEWLINNPQDLFTSYLQYRNILLGEVLDQAGNQHDKEHAQRVIDLIHMQYFLRHAPDESFDSIITESMSGKSGSDIFRSHEVSMALVREAADFQPLDDNSSKSNGTSQPKSSARPKPHPTNGAGPMHPAIRKIASLEPKFPKTIGTLRRLKRAVAGPATDGNQRVCTEDAMAPVLPQQITSNTRNYLLQPAFISPPVAYGITSPVGEIESLVASLEHYRW